MASHSPAEFTQLQRSFLSTMLDTHAAADQNSKASSVLKTYMLTALTYHFRAAITIPIPVDDTLLIDAMVHSEKDVQFQVTGLLLLLLLVLLLLLLLLLLGTRSD